jgi:uncharacterized protein
MNQARYSHGDPRPDAADGIDLQISAPRDFLVRLESNIADAGGELIPDADREGSVGATMFDLPSSEDNSLVVLLPRENLQDAPSQALVRIKSPDGRTYLGIVTAGPFAEPDSLRGDSHMLVTVATRGGIFLPPYHGRVHISILGEELADGALVPPRLRPLPNSPVFALNDEESATVLRASGDIQLGLVTGHANVVVGVPSEVKSVLPRHTAVLGTTGGGKSTTIARLIQQAQRADMAVIVLDVEGEYTFLHEPTDNIQMLTALEERGVEPVGISEASSFLHHLVGRDSANQEHPHLMGFSLEYERLSPYAVIEILALPDAQQDRFWKAYDVAKAVLRELGIFPAQDRADEDRLAMELDEFECGYPRLTLPLMVDVVGACLDSVEKREIRPNSSQLRNDRAIQSLNKHIHAAGLPGHPASWRGLLGRLGRLNRIRVFDQRQSSPPLRYSDLLTPGRVSVIDLSDSGASELNNIVIADLLRGIQEAQNAAYEAYEAARRTGRSVETPARVLLIIEEAHEFLSKERIEKMPNLFAQVARIAKRGRKRWLGLVFVTQFPQQLPREIFGLVNSYIMHKITDPQVISTLQRTVSGIDESLWKRLPGLAPGQAIVSFPHMTRPLLVSIDPSPAKLRLVD